MRVRTEQDYYAILGVAETAREDELKRAYRKLALQYHPDRNRGDKRAEEHFKQVSEAYAVLMDAERRREYDSLRSSRAAGQRPSEPRWRQEDLYRDLFTDPRTASVFDDLAREWSRMGLRVNEQLFRELFFQGRGVIVIGPFGVRWVGPNGPQAATERVADDGRATATAGSDVVPSLPGFLGWLWGRARESVVAPLRRLKGRLGLPATATRQGDLQYEVALGAEDLQAGGRYRLTIERGGRPEQLLVKIPAGTRVGTRLRLRGKGEPTSDGTPGDLYLHVRSRS
jgi:curved DNA-binding protein CbpA